jgi:hypothetical protein
MDGMKETQLRFLAVPFLFDLQKILLNLDITSRDARRHSAFD